MEREETSRSEVIEKIITQPENLPEDPSKRRFLKAVGYGAIGLGGIYIASKVPHFFSEQPLTLEEYDRYSEELDNYTDFDLIDHNAANNPVRREIALKGSAKFIETDAIDFDNQPYIAHSIEEFKRDIQIHPEYLETQRADFVLREIIESGKNPSIDSKHNPRDRKGFERLEITIDNIVPDEAVVTWSGEPTHVKNVRRENSVLIPTYGPRNIDEYFDLAEHEWNDVDPEFIRVGASLSTSLNPRFSDSDLEDIINYNKQRNFESNIYIVDDIRKILKFVRWGATKITTDNRKMIERTMQARMT